MLGSFSQSVSFKRQKDSAGEIDSSLEFKSGFSDPHASNNIIETSGPLWGPGIRVQQTPALTAQKLELWRSYGEQPKSINAAAELDKLYASLPEDKLDLTLKDLVEARKLSPRAVSPKATPAKGGNSLTIGAILGRKNPKEVKKGAAREDGGKFKPKNKVHNSPSISLPFKLPALSPRRDKLLPDNRPERGTLSSPFNAVQSGSSPRAINAGSSASFSIDYDSGTFTIGDEISKSYPPDLQHRQSSDSMDSLTLRQQLNHSAEGSSTTNVQSLPQAQECSICSTSNLIFKSRCTVCGKIYCPKCVRKGMGSMRDGRKCKKTCAGRSSNSRKKAGSGCWPLFRFSNNHANVAEMTAKMGGQRQDGLRVQEFELQRKSKSSSYPPSRTNIQRASVRRSPPRASPRQSAQNLPLRPSDHHHSHYSFPTDAMNRP